MEEAPERVRLADRVDGLDVGMALSVVTLVAGLWMLLSLAWAMTVLGGVGLAWVLFVAVVEKLATVRASARDGGGR